MSESSILAARAAEVASTALIMVDEALSITYLNASAEALLQRSRRKLLGAALGDVGPLGLSAAVLAKRALHEERELHAHDFETVDAGHTRRLTLDIVPDGRGACVSLRVSPEASGSSRGAVAASAAEGFGRMLSHELKNPIAGARGAAQLIAQADISSDEQQLAELIIRELDRAQRIAERWSSIGDLSPGPLGPVNLHTLLRDAMGSARAGASSAIKWREAFDPSLPLALADRDLALQAVLNVMINAAEAIDPDGHIEIATRYRTTLPGGSTPEARLEVSVADDGPGVPEALIEGVFNPFVTGKPAGEGLGLAFVSRTMALHGGGVEFESHPGRTVFRLFFREVRE